MKESHWLNAVDHKIKKNKLLYAEVEKVNEEEIKGVGLLWGDRNPSSSILTAAKFVIFSHFLE